MVSSLRFAAPFAAIAGHPQPRNIKEGQQLQIHVATRHGSLSEATQQRVAAKAEKLTRFFDRLTAIEVIVDLKNEEAPRVDIKVSAEHKHDFQAHGEAESLMASVDAVVQKVEQQLRKYKERVQERHRNHDVRRQEILTDPEPGS